MTTKALGISQHVTIRQSFATVLVDPRETATAIGISNFSRMTLRSVAPTVAGYVFETLSLSLPFLSGAGLMVANAMLYRALLPVKEQVVSAQKRISHY
ncbi:MAG: hypothetical protein PVF15_00345 [Candidatus Bathyarchaeota archaeon]